MTIIRNKAFRVFLYILGYAGAAGVIAFAFLSGLRYSTFQNDIGTAESYAETTEIKNGVTAELLTLQNMAVSRKEMAESGLENASLDLLDYSTGTHENVPLENLSETEVYPDAISGLKEAGEYGDGAANYYDPEAASGTFLRISSGNYLRLVTENCLAYSPDLMELFRNSPELLSADQREVYEKLSATRYPESLMAGDYFLFTDNGLFVYSPSANQIRLGDCYTWLSDTPDEVFYISLPNGYSEKEILSGSEEGVRDLLGGMIFRSAWYAAYASLNEEQRRLIWEHRNDEAIILGGNSAVSFEGDGIYSSKLNDQGILREAGYFTGSVDSYQKLADAIRDSSDVFVGYDHQTGVLEQWYKDPSGTRHDYAYVKDLQEYAQLAAGSFVLGIPLYRNHLPWRSFEDLGFELCRKVPNPALFLILSGVVFLLCVIFILIGEPAKLRKVDKIPFELFVIGYLILMFLFALWIPRTIGSEIFALVEQDLPATVTAILFVILALYLINAGLFTTITRRIKARGFLSTLLIPKLALLIAAGCRALGRRVKKSWRRLSDNYRKSCSGHKRLTIFGSVFFGVNAFVLLLFGMAHPGALLFSLILIAAEAYAGYRLLKYSAGVEKVLAVSRRIENGELDAKTETQDLQYNVRELGESLNNLGDGLAKAVDSSLRDERTKAELITNVSHDIKTPLTSVISYVDLLKKEPAGSEKAAEYIEVLDKKSQRLKQLILDLIEASKTGTGNIELDCMNLDLSELLDQALGEYEEKLAANGLEVVKNVRAEEGAVIFADGRRIFRIIDNLLNNVLKYAQPGTRVYADLDRRETDSGPRIILSIKNVSREMLNISAEELTERFVRGDRSRHTEGSGLGLSIAKNLTELQGGTFGISIDGDLFKAEISFPAAMH